MPNTVAQHAVATFTSPVNGTTPIDANTVRGNDNTTRTSFNSHDADPGIHLQSSTLASRPVAGTAGRKWITADTGSYRVWYDDGTTWQEVTYLSGGGGTITGNLLITGTLGVTGLITATGGVSGNVTGNLTGNASTATALATARNINGVSFNGTADITVTAAAGTLTGSTLASGVTASSLTSVGTLTSLAVSGNLAVDTNTLFVDAANNRVGVGTATPASTLDVVGGNISIASGNVFYLSGSGGNAYLQESSGTVFIGAGGAGRVQVNSSGNLGLGVTPSAWSASWKALQVNAQTTLFAGSTSGYLGVNIFNDGTNKYIGTGEATLYEQATGAHKWYTAPSGTAGNAISFTQAMTLNASGNLGVGTASPAQKLEVAGRQRYSGSTVGASLENQITGISVTTSAVTIHDDAGPLGRLCVVNGSDGSNRFCDLVLASTSVAPTVVQSFTSLGSPAARTYTRSGSALQVAMASGTYSVFTLALGF